MAAAATGDGCLIPSGWNVRPNYRLAGVYMNASRAVWILANGDPRELQVLHTCHNGDIGCVSIHHLYLGDNLRNRQDMVDSGRRMGKIAVQGETCGTSKLTESDIRRIRELRSGGSSQQSIADKFGVTQKNISCIVRRLTWKHIA